MKKATNIVLIGYRGTGKSAVGGILAEKTGWPLVSSDEEIVKSAAKSIPEIVSEQGWEAFRDLEAEVIDRCSRSVGSILDCGGGAVLRERNRRALLENGFVVWLTAEVSTIVRRISDDDQRPSLTGAGSFLEEIGDVLAERTPVYREAAHRTVATDSRTPAEVADEVLRLFAEDRSRL